MEGQFFFNSKHFHILLNGCFPFCSLPLGLWSGTDKKSVQTKYRYIWVHANEVFTVFPLPPPSFKLHLLATFFIWCHVVPFYSSQVSRYTTVAPFLIHLPLPLSLAMSHPNITYVTDLKQVSYTLAFVYSGMCLFVNRRLSSLSALFVLDVHLASSSYNIVVYKTKTDSISGRRPIWRY